MVNTVVGKRGRHLFRYFKALGNPVRFLIIYRMLDGRPYTKNELLSYVSALSRVPETTVDRHFRTLLKYGIVRTVGKSLKYSERGRKPLLYVLAADSLTFYVNLFTYLLEGTSDKRLKTLEKSLGNVENLLDMIDDVRLKLYLISDEIDDEVSTNLIKVLDSSVTLFSLVREIIRPRISVSGCENALEFLKSLSSNQVLIKKVSADKIKRLLYATYTESNIPLKKLSALLGIKDLTKPREYDDLWREIEVSYGNDIATLLTLLTSNVKCSEEGDYIISLTNNLIKYVLSEIKQHDLVQLILAL